MINAFDPQWQGAVPYTVLLDPEGKVIYDEVGSVGHPRSETGNSERNERAQAVVIGAAAGLPSMVQAMSAPSIQVIVSLQTLLTD